MTLPDIQNQVDQRGVALDEVGIDGVRCPTIFDDGSLVQAGIGDFAITVSLPSERRGTHMSRMVEIVEDLLRTVDPRQLPTVLKQASSKLEVDAMRLGVALPVAVRVESPASGQSAWQTSDVQITGVKNGDAVSVGTKVTAQVTSLCPCSKAISDYGAHNQRSDVTVETFGFADDPYPIRVGQLIELARSVGSCPVYPLVKRPDERFITMAAFDNPAFVEDMARDLSVDLRSRTVSHRVSIRNLESIHSHDAVASVSWTPDAVASRM
ncbi:GTP cyclohydrolase I [Marmoricola sp. OAE513]|uniref:GTP cyclohydrolase FolE2 n=1 Tax=Marmoricola sp. OAE513 TaxID=2817894 RepID=UPI001AE3F981